MAAKDDLPIELSDLGSWRGLRPGMTRAEVIAVIEGAGEAHSESDLEPDLMTIEAWGMELRLAEGPAGRLRQIGLQDVDSRWAGNEILDEPLHAVLSIIGPPAQQARWRAEDAFNEPFEDLKPAPLEPPSLEVLLGDGTVWLPQLGIGLTLYDAFVGEVVWRQSSDVPTQFSGPVTDAQIRLSMSEEWRSNSPSKNSVSHPGGGWNAAQIGLTALLVFTMGWLAWSGVRETQAWSQALELNGRLAALESKPGKPAESRYRIEFKDPEGQRQIVSLERADFYLEPNKIGDQVTVFYVPEHPARVKGPARARDAAFLRYMPWAAAVFAAYGFAMMGAGFLPRKKQAETGGDPLVKQF